MLSQNKSETHESHGKTIDQKHQMMHNGFFHTNARSVMRSITTDHFRTYVEFQLRGKTTSKKEG